MRNHKCWSLPQLQIIDLKKCKFTCYKVHSCVLYNLSDVFVIIFLLLTGLFSCLLLWKFVNSFLGEALCSVDRKTKKCNCLIYLKVKTVSSVISILSWWKKRSVVFGYIKGDFPYDIVKVFSPKNRMKNWKLLLKHEMGEFQLKPLILFLIDDAESIFQEI